MGITIRGNVGPAPQPAFPFKCPQCGTEQKIRLAVLGPGRTVRCTCGASGTIRGDGAAKVQQAVNALHDTLRRFRVGNGTAQR